MIRNAIKYARARLQCLILNIQFHLKEHACDNTHTYYVSFNKTRAATTETNAPTLISNCHTRGRPLSWTKGNINWRPVSEQFRLQKATVTYSRRHRGLFHRRQVHNLISRVHCWDLGFCLNKSQTMKLLAKLCRPPEPERELSGNLTREYYTYRWVGAHSKTGKEFADAL